MKKALLGLTGALLATSALIAGAQAATLDAGGPNPYSGVTPQPANTIAPVAIAAGAITGVATQVIGSAGVNDFFQVNLNGAYRASFAIRIDITGANFDTPSGLIAVGTEENGTAVTQSTCGTVASAQQLIVTCSYTGAQTDPAVERVIIRRTGGDAVRFTSPAALATPGSVIAVTGKVSPDANFATDLEPGFTAIPIVRSSTAINVAIAAGTGANNVLNQNAAVPFSRFTAGDLSAINGTYNVTAVPAVVDATFTAINLSLAATYSTTNRLVVTHDVLTQTPVSDVTIQLDGVNTLTIARASFVGNTATFTLSAAQMAAVVGAGARNITFNLAAANATPILAAAAGSASFSVDFASLTDPAAFTGPLAAITRGGFTAHLNNFYTLASAYESFIRIVNTSNTAGTANLRIWDAGTGALVCTAATPSISGQSSLEANRSTIIALCPALPSPLPTYLNAEVSTAFNGYAQHVVWNNRATVTDLSARRNTVN